MIRVGSVFSAKPIDPPFDDFNRFCHQVFWRMGVCERWFVEVGFADVATLFVNVEGAEVSFAYYALEFWRVLAFRIRAS